MDSSFYGQERDPKFELLAQLWPPVSPWRWLKIISRSEKKLKSFPYWNMSEWKLYISSPLSGKNTNTFCTIWAILGRKQGGVTIQKVTIKIWHNLYNPHDSWSTSCKNFWLQHFQFCSYRSQRTFQKNINPDFQVWLLFLVPRLHIWNEWVILPHA